MNRTATHPLLTNGRASAPAGPARPPGSPWSLRDAAAFWGVSERHVAGLVAEDKVRSIKIGARRLIPDDEVRRVAREGTG
jgi:hypothetical protein